MLAHTPSFGISLIFAIDFTSSAFHVTGAFYSTVPALHSQSIHIRHRSLFCLISLRSPFDTLAIHSYYTRTLYTLTVNITCIPLSCEF
jgi:hypothetical protein